MEMAEGLITMYKNLREAVEAMDNIDATWLTIPLNPRGQLAGMLLAKIPPFSSSWSLQRALLTRHYVRSLERAGKSFDAAYFNTAPIAFFLRRFRRRVPSVDALDSTPSILARYGYNRPRADGNLLVRRVRHSLVRNVSKEAIYLLPWSRFAKESLVSDYGIPEGRISIVPPGVNLKIWSPQGKTSHVTGTSAKNTRILFVGGNFNRKGGDLLSNVARREEFQQYEFHFVTKGFDSQRGSNIFIHDSLEPNSEALISLYRQADIFVLPTRSDVFSLACLEAMAMGLPVITTDVGGIREIVIDGENGFLVPAGDEGALLEPLRALIADTELRRRLGSSGRRSVETKFNLKTMAETTVEFLVKAATTRGARNE
jgi:glycosyltransferase involved in cell wall biosynthesis